MAKNIGLCGIAGIQPIGGGLLRKLTKRLGNVLAFFQSVTPNQSSNQFILHMNPLNPPIQQGTTLGQPAENPTHEHYTISGS